MATVFMPYAEDWAEVCEPVNEDYYDLIDELIDGMPRASTWKPLRMRIERENIGRKLEATDCPLLDLGMRSSSAGARSMLFGRCF